MRSNLAVFLAAVPCALVAGSVLGRPAQPQDSRSATAASLGSQELAGGTLEIPFTIGSVTPFESNGHITGSVASKQSAYRKITGLTLALLASPPGSHPPAITGGTVRVGDMKIARIPGASGASPAVRLELRDIASDGFPMELTIDLAQPAAAPGSPACDLFTLQITPSTTCTPGGECDVLPVLSVTSDKPANDAILARPGCRGVVVPIRNGGVKPARGISELRGSYVFGEANALADATLLEKIEGPAASGAKGTIDSDATFTVTGAAILPGEMRYLVLHFKKTPVGPTTLSVQAKLAE